MAAIEHDPDYRSSSWAEWRRLPTPGRGARSRRWRLPAGYASSRLTKLPLQLNRTSLSGSFTGSRRTRAWSTNEKMAELAPTPWKQGQYGDCANTSNNQILPRVHRYQHFT